MGRELKAKGEKAPVQEKKSFSIGALTQNLGLSDSMKTKPLEYMMLTGPLPGVFPFHDMTGIGGPAVGFLNIVRGHTNTGKSTFVNACIKWCQENGHLPVIIDTENNFSFKHAEEGGMQLTWTVDEEGEMHPSGDFIYINNYSLFNLIGKNRCGSTIVNGKKELKRSAATVEDVAAFVQMMDEKHDRGEIPMPVCYIWDAMGTLGCDASLEGKSHNNMWDAAAMNLNFRDIFFQTIPNSRMMDAPYTKTMVIVAKVRHDMSVGGMGTTRMKGGEIAWQAARLIFHLGGSISHGTGPCTATFNKKTTNWGITAKVKVAKNHVEGASYEGVLISTPQGFIPGTDEAKAAYIKMYKPQILAKLELTEDVELEIKTVDATEG